jgi:mono/diheme cytochrome c family protein
MKKLVLILILLFFVYETHAQIQTIKIRKEPNHDLENGKKLFRQYCAPCHSETDQVLTGPVLIGVTKRLDMKWLISWVRNSTELIRSGDKYANELYDQWGTSQPEFEFLSKKEIKAVFMFVETFVPASSTNKEQ